MAWERDEAERQKRGTLGEIATAAGVPYEFAGEAQTHDLIRPNGGRTQRRRRYRRRLATRIGKLYKLRQAGYSWDELKVWSKRRFRVGHSHEIAWPEGLTGNDQVEL